MREEYDNEVVFDFEDNHLKNMVVYEMKLVERMERAFDYIFDKLIKFNEKFGTKLTALDLGELKLQEGKNYNWCAFNAGVVQFIARTYGQHVTLFIKYGYHYNEKHDYTLYKYASMTYYTELKGMSDDEHDSMLDKFYNNPFFELNKVFPSLLEMIKENKLHAIWNNISFERPDYCEPKLAYNGEDIRSLDLTIFCAEELSTKHSQLYAENEMLEMLKSIVLTEGMELQGKKIKEVCTEFPKEYSDPYYHGVGILLEGDSFKDVYTLTRWYLEDVKKLISM